MTAAGLVLFDLDNTLVDRDAALAAWVEEFSGHWRLGPDAAAWLTELDGDGLRPKAEVFTAIRDRFDLPSPVAELWAQYRRRHAELMRCEPAVSAGLTRLRAAGWRIGVVTNGTNEQQVAALWLTGLADLVDGWCVSEAEGLRKPDPRIFALAAERCCFPGLRPAADARAEAVLMVGAPMVAASVADTRAEVAAAPVWMVGDSVAADIGGGQAAGLRTAWIRRGRTWPATARPPDLVADRVTEVIDALLDGGATPG
ncbi:HAD family hydrolase [Kitasatospora sp. NBC_01287]|uniref:HAD family hydrolase n=1 Tax=Kitasatospora sp. NBC_01287 TaxID=2903573 RepID=UPI002251AD00|nr:HAD family hydrolase [Kitasatospora sp. NBC_01287]MCX4750867.1 HAD family hydrolase [Kitasatospora sp. NBC_01287]